MARIGAASRVPGINFLPFLFSLFSLVLIVIILAAGTRPGVLDDVYFFKVRSLWQLGGVARR